MNCIIKGNSNHIVWWECFACNSSWKCKCDTLRCMIKFLLPCWFTFCEKNVFSDYQYNGIIIFINTLCYIWSLFVFMIWWWHICVIRCINGVKESYFFYRSHYENTAEPILGPWDDKDVKQEWLWMFVILMLKESNCSFHDIYCHCILGRTNGSLFNNICVMVPSWWCLYPL